MSGRQQAKAAERASNAQNEADARAIAEQQRQFDALQALMKPYVQASSGVAASAGGAFDAQAYLAQNPDVAANPAFAANPEAHYNEFGKAEGRVRPVTAATGAQKGSLQLQQDLIGMNGDAAQRAAYDQIQNSAGFQAQLQQGQNAMLQSASATGGLRGGNTQAAMAQFAPALLNQAIGAQYQNLGGMTALGQNAAAMQGNAGMQSANQIGGLYQSQGANTAGYQLARGQANANTINGITSLGTTFLGGGFSGMPSSFGALMKGKV
jgi:hypothetical protein